MEKLESEVLENPLSVDTDIKTQVVGWDRYIDLDKNNAAKQAPNPYNRPINKGSPDNVFDSLFTNSFLSASSVISQQPVISTKPKRNILGTSKNSALKMTKTALTSAATPRSRGNLPTTTITTTLAATSAVTATTTATKTLTKTITSRSRGTSTDSMVTTDITEILKESKSFKDELLACEQNDMKKNKDVCFIINILYYLSNSK